MNNPQNRSFKSYYILILLLSFFIVADIVLFALSIFSMLIFLCVLVFFIAMLIITIVAFVINKKKKIQKINLSAKKFVITDQDLIDMYNKAGIPIIYDEEGRLKNIFELLGVSETYDENGRRILTIYEQLGIVPRFTKQGVEIPTVLVIKNKINGLVKPEKKTSVLTRVVTDEEKEELLLKQMLAQKLEEAEKNGDTKKAKVIKKIAAQKKKESESKSKPDGYVVFGKPVKTKTELKVKTTKYKNSFDTKLLFGSSAGKRPKQSKGEADKPKGDNTKSPSGFLLKDNSSKKVEEKVLQLSSVNEAINNKVAVVSGGMHTVQPKHNLKTEVQFKNIINLPSSVKPVYKSDADRTVKNPTFLDVTSEMSSELVGIGVQLQGFDKNLDGLLKKDKPEKSTLSGVEFDSCSIGELSGEFESVHIESEM